MNSNLKITTKKLLKFVDIFRSCAVEWSSRLVIIVHLCSAIFKRRMSFKTLNLAYDIIAEAL